MKTVGSHLFLCCGKRRYKAATSTRYRACVLQVKRRGYLTWHGLQFGSGFDVRLEYAKRVKVSAEVFGLNDDYDLTPPLARFLEVNRHIIQKRLPMIEDNIFSYRHHLRRESQWKSQVLSYRFLSHIYNQPRDPDGLSSSSIAFERDLRVRDLMLNNEAVLQAAYKRLESVSRSAVVTCWYIFWVRNCPVHHSFLS